MSEKKDIEFYRMNAEGLKPSATFRSFEGLSPYHLRCEDSNDLGPAADIIVRAITDKQEAMAQAGDERPLVVLMGENHSCSAQKALQKAVMSRLLVQEQDFEARIEMPHNLGGVIAKDVFDYYSAYIALQKAVMSRLLVQEQDFEARIEVPHNLDRIKAKDVFDLSVPDDLYYDWQAYDEGYQATLLGYLARVTPDMAPAACLDLMDFCRKHRIATCFNDAARSWQIDMKDRLTARITEETGYLEHYREQFYIDAAEAAGMHIRNQVMASFPAQKKLVLQFTGRAHIAGVVSGTYRGSEDQDTNAYAHSLSVTYQEAGCAVLPVLLSTVFNNYGANILPEEAYDILPHSVLIDNLAETEFYKRDAFSGKEQRFLTETLYDSTASEAVRALREEFTDVLNQRGDYKEPALAEAQKVIARYNASHSPVASAQTVSC